jgi:hypothetical protein
MGKALAAFRLGVAVVVSAGPQARQSVGIRPLSYARRRHTDLALDMYEHSYHIDFGAKAASYVDTFMGVIRWSSVDRILKHLHRTLGRIGTGHKAKPGGPTCVLPDLLLHLRRRHRHRECPRHRLAESRYCARPGRRRGGDVHRYGFPRTDLQVTVDGVTIRPHLRLAAGSLLPMATWPW